MQKSRFSGIYIKTEVKLSKEKKLSSGQKIFLSISIFSYDLIKTFQYHCPEVLHHAFLRSL